MYAVKEKPKSITNNKIKINRENITIQRALAGSIDKQTNTYYQVTYTGKKSDFSGGSDPLGSGITGVTDYSAEAEVKNSVVGNKDYKDKVAVSAATREYHYGHMLPKALGGTGYADNIFKQDGGQNTTGNWPSFERTVATYKNTSPQSAHMSYRVILHGAGGTLKYNQIF